MSSSGGGGIIPHDKNATTVTHSAPQTKPVGGFWSTVLADFEGWFKQAETFVEDEAIQLWSNIFKPIILGIPAAQAKILVTLIQTGIKDIRAKSLEEVEVELLNMAISDELSFLKGLESSVIQGFVALVKAGAPKP